MIRVRVILEETKANTKVWRQQVQGSRKDEGNLEGGGGGFNFILAAGGNH